MADLKTTNIYGDAYINNKVGINTNTPATRLQIGQLSPTAATEGLQFGDDTGARMYRSAASTISIAGNFNASGGTITSTYGGFSSPGLILGDAQYGFYVASGNLYYKSAAGGNHYWRNIANNATTLALDNSGNLTALGNISAANLSGTNTGDQTVGNGTITIAAGTGISVASNTFTTNQTGNSTVTVTNSGVTSAVAGTGVGVSAATGAVTFSIGQAVGTGNTPSFAGIVSSAVTNYAFLQVTDTNNFWITPGNANWGLYFETTAGGLLGGTGDSNRLGFVGSGAARFYVDLNNGNGWFGGNLTATNDTVTGATMTYLTGAYQNTTVYDSPRTQSATPSRGIRAPASSIQFTDSYAIAPYWTYRSTGDWPVPYGIGWGTGGESSGIFQRYASNGSSFGDMIFYTGNDGYGAFSFRRHTWEGTTYFAAGSGELNTELFRIDWTGKATATSFALPGGFTISDPGSGYAAFSNWVQLGTTGFYSSNNGAHFYPNNGTFGSWRIAGTRNSWYGIEFDSGTCLMTNSSEVGFYRLSYGWQMRWYAGTGYIYKGNPGGGTEATILDSSNQSYAWAMNQNVTTTSSPSFTGLTVGGSNATIYRDLIVNGGIGNPYGNRIIVQGTATTYTLQDSTLRPTVYLNGDYPVVTLNCSATTNAAHGPTIQFAFNGLTTGGSTSRQIVIGANGVGGWLDFGFSGGGYGDNTNYNPHNGISGYSGTTAMRLFSNGLLVGGTGTYPNHITSISNQLDVRGTGYFSGAVTASVFTGAGTGLTGTAASLSIGGNAATATNATTAGGLAVHAGRNNEANKIVRTDGNGYIQAGWINTPSGDMPDTESIDKIYCSSDDYVRYKGVADFKQQIGLTFKNSTPRNTNTTDTNYWTGVMGWGTTDWNTMFDWGSGFTDSWSSPANKPTDSTHHVGLQVVHYTNGSGRYGWQMANGGGTSRWWLRDVWGGSFSAWFEILTSTNYTNFAPSLTGTGASGNWAINITGNAATATTLQTGRAINGVSFNGSAAITVNGLNYNINDNWLRENGDDAQFQMYGNSRTMIYRTDGTTNPHGGGAYAHIFYYGGSADGNRTFIINTDGRLWSPYHGWLDTMNVASATNLSTTRANWSTNGTITAVVGQLSWKNYGNGHTIFDASAATSPATGAISNTNPDYAWAATYPTLMGWNGANTYGVRVDSSRYSDQATTAVVNASNTSAGWYPIVWHSGNTLYSTANVLLWAQNGYIQANYFNSSDDVSSGNISYIMAKFGDGYLRSATAAKVAAFISNQTMSIQGSSTSCSGNAATVTNGVYTTGAQSISGVKTFSDPPVAVNIAKAWVHFNGTGTVAINTSYNVSSITDNGVGDYTVNFTSAFVDANYVVAGTSNLDYTNNSSNYNVYLSVPRQPNAQQAGSCRLATEYPAGVGLYDCVAVRAVFFR